MTADIAQQGQALCQALLLGGGLGVVYDLLRILRVRLPWSGMDTGLDFLFWVWATAALFLWSQDAWGGEIRLYGAVFCLLGGGIYFLGLSRAILWVGYRLADLTTILLKTLLGPLRLGISTLKKIRKVGKNTFLFGAKW